MNNEITSNELVTGSSSNDAITTGNGNDTIMGSLGNDTINAQEIETTERIFEFRRSCYLKHDCKSGDEITAENLTTLRPNKGIDSRDYFRLLGKKLLVNKKAFEAIYWNEVED